MSAPARLPELPGVSVVVMAYNEAESLESVVREIHAALERLGTPREVVIVDDGSTDGTVAVAEQLARALDAVRVVRHPRNRGLGGVYRTGFAEARQPLLTFFPADGQFPSVILGQFLPLMADHDLVLGYIQEGPGTLWADLLARTERLLYRLLFGRLPRFQGVFMVRRVVLPQVPLKSEGRGWAVVMEMIIRVVRAGYRVESVPTAFRPRRAGTSKVRNLRTIVSNTAQLIGLVRHL